MKKLVSNIRDKLLRRRKKVTIQANVLSIKTSTEKKPEHTAYAVLPEDKLFFGQQYDEM